MLRKRRYSKDLRVPPTHPNEPRKWYLAESAGEIGRALQKHMPWHNVAALGSRRSPAAATHLALVASVAKDV
jgi:hypothetical protein